MKQCKWCKSFFETSDKPHTFMASHSRWCDKNPIKQKYLDDLKERDNVKLMNQSRKKSGITNQFTKAKLDGDVISHSIKGKKHPNPFKGHTTESKQKLREKALKSNHRRLRKGMVEYKGVMLDSSWELALAMRLDKLQIKWIRPEPLKWVDVDGNEHNYFPDFYLEKYDLYLDPKNPAAYQNQKEKINILKKTYSNLKFILTLKECETFEVH
jgi:hypothetical protein